MSVRLQVDLPERDLTWSLPPGAAHDLADDVPEAALDAVVAWLSGRVGPWRRTALRLDGRALGHRRTAARVRRGLVTIGPPVLAPAVTIRDHLAAAAPQAVADRLLDTVPLLAGRGHEPAGVLSGGERQMVGWARAALIGPRVVLLDRAATGLDPEASTWAIARLAAWREAGCVALVRVGRAEEADWTTRTRPNGRISGPRG